LWQICSHSTMVTEAIGRELGKLLSPGDIICLTGELGAGKTVLVRGIASGLGVEEPVSSPSFLIIQEYQGKYPVFHCDFYRLGSYQELVDIGWEEYFNRGGVILVEWGNLIPDAFPADFLEVKIQHTDEETGRLLQFFPKSQHYRTIVEELSKRCGSWE